MVSAKIKARSQFFGLILNIGLDETMTQALPDTGLRENLPQLVPMNHFFVVPDAATYRAISNSDFLRREFAVTEIRTTTRGDSTYTGFYLYGVNTYFEFLEIARNDGIRTGDSGVAFGSDQTGGLQTIAAALPGEFPAAAPIITREYEGHSVPWFFMATPESFPYKDPAGFSFWLMEYHPGFLSKWKPRPTGPQSGISRRDILQRYAGVLPDKPGAPLFQEVIELTVALEQPKRAKWMELCSEFGYRVHVQKGASILEGPDFTLRLLAANGSVRGIRAVRMRLHRGPPKLQEHKFGSTALKLFPDGTATWSF